jgi:hypothetical protein
MLNFDTLPATQTVLLKTLTGPTSALILAL